MKYAKIISIIGIVAMSVALIYGFKVGDFGVDGGEIVQNPWGIVSLVDLYTGFILFSGWIVYREKSIFKSTVWVLLMMTLGFFTASVYTLITLIISEGDWKVFWMGRRVND